MGAKKSDGTALTLTTQENVIKKTYGKRFAIPLDFDFFKHPIYPYGLKEDLTITIKLNFAKEVILYTGDTNAVYKISDIILEYDEIFDVCGLCHKHKRDAYYGNGNSIHQCNINSLSSTL